MQSKYRGNKARGFVRRYACPRWNSRARPYSLARLSSCPSQAHTCTRLCATRESSLPSRRKKHEELAERKGHKPIVISKEDENKIIGLQALARGRAARKTYQRKVG